MVGSLMPSVPRRSTVLLPVRSVLEPTDRMGFRMLPTTALLAIRSIAARVFAIFAAGIFAEIMAALVKSMGSSLKVSFVLRSACTLALLRLVAPDRVVAAPTLPIRVGASFSPRE